MVCYAACKTTRISIFHVGELARIVGIHIRFRMCQAHVNVCGRYVKMSVVLMQINSALWKKLR
uniref:Secreted protein n=1 Tax=Elaeophora elaphi TaxID=1147741 RepID=A0A0R3RND9_9BILA